MESFKHKSARRKQSYSDTAEQLIGKNTIKAIEKNERWQEKVESRRRDLEDNSVSYRAIKISKIVLDDFYVDGILGIIFPVVSDVVTSALYLPSIYVSLVKIKSIPLTLAVIFNSLLDTLIGMIPIIGQAIDFFFKAHKKNYALIMGYVNDDRKIISEVKKKATFMALGIVLLFYMIVLVINYVMEFATSVYNWFSALFS